MKKVYLFNIDETKGKGVFRISQVSEPAIEINFVAFNKEDDIEDFMKFSVDEEKMQLAGPILVANKEIYRKSLDGYIKFTNESLIAARDSFKRNNDNAAFNVEHSNQEAPSFLIEDWITEPGVPDKSQKWGFNSEEPTWFGVVQITDKDYWEKYIKTGVVKGFSVEIDTNSVKIKEDFNMKKPIESVNLGKADMADGTSIFWEGETIVVGTKLFTDEALTMAVADGEIAYNDLIIVVKDGVVTEIKPAEQPQDAPQLSEEVKTEEETKVEYIAKDEFTQIISQLNARIDALENKLTEKDKSNEELSKQVETLSKENEELKAKPASFLFNKNKKSEPVAGRKPLFSEMLKQSYIEQGKL